MVVVEVGRKWSPCLVEERLESLPVTGVSSSNVVIALHDGADVLGELGHVLDTCVAEVDELFLIEDCLHSLFELLQLEFRNISLTVNCEVFRFDCVWDLASPELRCDVWVEVGVELVILEGDRGGNATVVSSKIAWSSEESGVLSCGWLCVSVKPD